MNKKSQQLKENISTAQARLYRDILWDLVVKTNQNTCFHCSKEMTRETFSVEHKIPWLDSSDPITLFYSIGNIAFSHKSCNISAARKNKGPQTPHGTFTRYAFHKCRCEACTKANREHRTKYR